MGAGAASLLGQSAEVQRWEEEKERRKKNLKTENTGLPGSQPKSPVAHFAMSRLLFSKT
jgi:hypothetical protein